MIQIQLTLVQEPFGYAFVGVDAAVAEEGPVLAGDFDEFGVQVGDQDLFFVVAGLGEDAAEGVGDEAATPELDAGCGCVVAGAVEFYGGGVAVGGDDFEFDVAVLVAYAVDGADEDSVGDGVGALGCLPGVVLGGCRTLLFRRGASRWRWGRRESRLRGGR